MHLSLIDDDREWVIEIPIDGTTRMALLLQHLRESEPLFRERFLYRLGLNIPTLVWESLDIGLHPPTQRQIAFALDIARTLGLPIPGDALRYREYMGDFIESHVMKYRQVTSAPFDADGADTAVGGDL
jgi:hypothetical protein